MEKATRNRDATDIPRPYMAGLTPEQAATAMQAARMNAVELLETAEILFTLKRFPHSLVLSTLAIEENGKLNILMSMLLGFDGEKLNHKWKSYRKHQAKTEMLNLAIQCRVRATFPQVSLQDAKEIGARGPTPSDLGIE